MILFLSWHTQQAIMKLLLQEMLLSAFLFMASLMIQKIATHECGIESYSIYQMILKGHTFDTFNARTCSLDCSQACNSDVRCQSYNYVIFKDICELNKRTKDASPEDFVWDKGRYYMNAPKRGNDVIITRLVNREKITLREKARALDVVMARATS